MLVVLATHPIQYQVPVWQALARDERVPFEVWYVTDRHTRVNHDREFGETFAWDLNMLDGYPHRFLGAANGATPASFWKCRVTEDLVLRLRNCGARALWIQGWQVAAFWQAAFLARRAGVQLWLRGESNDLKHVTPLKQLVKRPMLKEFFRRVDQFLCIGIANRRLYESYGVLPSRLHATPYAVDNDRFKRQAAALLPHRASLRKRWNIPEDAFCVLFCGKFVSKKHPTDLVAACRLLHDSDQSQKLHILFVGSGHLGEQLRRQCAIAFDVDTEHPGAPKLDELNWRPPATFAGFLNQKEISQAYVAADCLVLPSDSGETWGLVVNEAMASGRPCAASRVCGCADDLLVPRWPERTFNLGDAAGIARSIAQIKLGDLSGDAERRQISAYTIQAAVDTVVHLYGTAVQQSPSDCG
jgi:glycosyltransferase involved in cell wall biosynthesis